MDSARIRSAAARAAAGAAALATTVAAGLLGTAGPAHANGATDFVLINTARIDVGLLYNPVIHGYPAPGAMVRWQANNTTLKYQPYLFGTFSVENSDDFCGKIRIEAFTLGGSSLDYADSEVVCPDTNAIEIGTADPALSLLNQSELHRVRVSALIQFYPGDAYQLQGYKDVYPYE
jgi:hypothetical protein